MPNPNQNLNEDEKKMSPKFDSEVSNINVPNEKKPFLQPKSRRQINQKKTYQDLVNTFVPSTEFNSFTKSDADNSTQLTHNQNTGQGDYFESHDIFFSKVKDLKAAKPFLIFSQTPIATKKTIANTGQNEKQPASKHSPFKSISDSPEEKLVSPIRTRVNPKKPEKPVGFEAKDKINTDLKKENTKGAFYEFLPKKNRSHSSPKTPIKGKSTLSPRTPIKRNTMKYSFKTP